MLAHARLAFVLALVASSLGCGDTIDATPPGTAENESNDGTAPPVDEVCTTDDADCCNACQHVHECRPRVGVSECEQRCLASEQVWNSHLIHCLALRVFWINEEGCPRVGPTWDNFDDDDDCTGPGPDEEGYGPF